MTIHLYNTLTRKKEAFEPADPKNVRMYVCGPTVYDRAHLGNARSVVVYDVLYRLLMHVYGEKHVKYVRNITDVDDKINAAAKAQGIPIQQLTGKVTGWFHEDMDALNVLRPNIEPKATEHIGQMIEMIELLIKNGKAYVAEGNVLFSVKSAPLHTSPRLRGEDQGGGWYYGILSGRIQEDLDAGARIKTESYKRDPNDFVLWKPFVEGDDPSSVFDSPWGKGRPGWHIECSAMSTEYLGHDFDIHGGGSDLMFPHHENEIAQSCGAYPHSHFAKYWVHNGFLTVNGEKMSKSLGNFITVRDLLEKGVKGEVIRYALLKTKYNEPLNWTDKLLDDAKKELDYLYRALGSVESKDLNSFDYKKSEDIEAYKGIYLDILSNDLNVPEYLAMLYSWATPLFHNKDVSIAARLKYFGNIIGVLQQDSEQWFKGGSPSYKELFGDRPFIDIIRDQHKAAAIELDKLNQTDLLEAAKIIFTAAFNELKKGQKENAYASVMAAGIEASTNAFRAIECTVSDSSRLIFANLISNKLIELLNNTNSAEADIIRLIDARIAAKKAKNWAEADRIRNELKAQGIILEDRPDGTTDWRRE